MQRIKLVALAEYTNVMKSKMFHDNGKGTRSSVKVEALFSGESAIRLPKSVCQVESVSQSWGRCRRLQSTQRALFGNIYMNFWGARRSR